MNFRSLEPFEVEVIKQALERLQLSPLVRHEIRIAAQAMLDQKMPENFLWRTK
jgi:hypothetical protein